jgi:hypothetical protein
MRKVAKKMKFLIGVNVALLALLIGIFVDVGYTNPTFVGVFGTLCALGLSCRWPFLSQSLKTSYSFSDDIQPKSIS